MTAPIDSKQQKDLKQWNKIRTNGPPPSLPSPPSTARSPARKRPNEALRLQGSASLTLADGHGWLICRSSGRMYPLFLGRYQKANQTVAQSKGSG